jgi:kynurenine 3-monooxygenase
MTELFAYFTLMIIIRMIDILHRRLSTVHCDKWHVAGKVLIMGDASHGIVPFFGQGTNSGFEDCYVLSQLLDSASGFAAPNAIDLERQYAQVFGYFELKRKLNCDAIAAMAIDNYFEMMARVGDATFLLKKAIENRIENAMPRKYRSRYAMVCYGGLGNVSYFAAQQLGEVQSSILDELAADPAVRCAADVSLARAEALIDARLGPLVRELGVRLETVSHDLMVSRL